MSREFKDQELEKLAARVMDAGNEPVARVKEHLSNLVGAVTRYIEWNADAQLSHIANTVVFYLDEEKKPFTANHQQAVFELGLNSDVYAPLRSIVDARVNGRTDAVRDAIQSKDHKFFMDFAGDLVDAFHNRDANPHALKSRLYAVMVASHAMASRGDADFTMLETFSLIDRIAKRFVACDFTYDQLEEVRDVAMEVDARGDLSGPKTNAMQLLLPTYMRDITHKVPA